MTYCLLSAFLCANLSFLSVALGDGHVQKGLLLSWQAGKPSNAPEHMLFDTSEEANHAHAVGRPVLSPDPARVELDGRSALVGAKPIRPKRISVEAAFRVTTVRGPLQLIVTTHAPRGRRPQGPVDGNPRQWVLEIRGDPPQEGYQGFLEFGIFGEDNNWHMVMSDRRIALGWHHALGTFDGERVRFFLDGTEQQRLRSGQPDRYRGKINVPPDGLINSPALGSGSVGSRCGFKGDIALCRFYDRALSQEEIERNHRHAQALVPELKDRKARQDIVKPPFKVLFSNDFTNIETCTSPYHAKGKPFEPGMLEATVREVQGVDVHMLQPAHGAVPWWPSKVYPLEEHHAWWAEQFGIEQEKLRVPSVHRYILGGGDPFEVYVDACRQEGQIPFISLRLNDRHHLTHAETPGNTQGMHAISRFYVEHPEWRLGEVGSGLDWAVPEVREHMFRLIEEICRNYDLDGFELDFMRFPNFFRDTTPVEERIEIITGFVARVRKLLDETASAGQHRWLCARVPCKLEMHDDVGIDLPSLVDAGLDLVNLSASYFTFQDHDLPEIRQLIPDAGLYVEMCHCTMTGKRVGVGGDNFLFQRTTKEQYTTTAHMVYSRGGDGVTLFNFVYYREHGTPGRGPFNEPPFDVLAHLGDPEWLARQPQWYFMSDNWFTGMEGRFEQGDARTFELDMAPTEHQTGDGIFRMMTQEKSEGRQWMVKVNGETLQHADYVEKPIDRPYPVPIGDESNVLCFQCPRSLAKNGINKVAFILEKGPTTTLKSWDLVLP